MPGTLLGIGRESTWSMLCRGRNIAPSRENPQLLAKPCNLVFIPSPHIREEYLEEYWHAYITLKISLVCYSLNIRYRKTSKTWGISSIESKHNHPPMSDLLQAYSSRHHQLTDEMKAFIQPLAAVNSPPADILAAFFERFPDGPMLTAQDIINKFGPTNSGQAGDAQRLMEMLYDRASKEPGWIIRQVELVSSFFVNEEGSSLGLRCGIDGVCVGGGGGGGGSTTLT